MRPLNDLRPVRPRKFTPDMLLQALDSMHVESTAGDTRDRTAGLLMLACVELGTDRHMVPCASLAPAAHPCAHACLHTQVCCVSVQLFLQSGCVGVLHSRNVAASVFCHPSTCANFCVNQVYIFRSPRDSSSRQRSCTAISSVARREATDVTRRRGLARAKAWRSSSGWRGYKATPPQAPRSTRVRTSAWRTWSDSSTLLC